MLEATGLSKRFGGLAALDDLSLEIAAGEIRGIIGPNGAGKTTLFNLISGTYRPTAGSIKFEGKEIGGLGPSRIAELGIIRTFQRVALFGKFTVLENVMVGRHRHAREGLWGAIVGTGRRVEAANRERAREIVDFIGLGAARDEPARNLPYGHQRALGVAIALAAEPRLLMLDEPVAGMNSAETQEMANLIRRIRERWGVTVLLVEHDMRTVMGLCEKITVLDFGRKLAEGAPREISENKDVIEAYLGADDFAA